MALNHIRTKDFTPSSDLNLFSKINLIDAFFFSFYFVPQHFLLHFPYKTSSNALQPIYVIPSFPSFTPYIYAYPLSNPKINMHFPSNFSPTYFCLHRVWHLPGKENAAS
jgi:hypothetical protein